MPAPPHAVLSRADSWPVLVTLSLHRLQGVWASKYNERALLSMRKVGLDFRDLRMAVLVQRVVPAAYAFVIHTHNPSTGHAPLKPPCRENSAQQINLRRQRLLGEQCHVSSDVCLGDFHSSACTMAITDPKSHAGSPDEVYAEVVAGLGESIVSGLVPGSALGCIIKKSDLDNPEVSTVTACQSVGVT
jgi:hypothetical protein